MEIVLPKEIGFCFGVNKSIDLACKYSKNARLYTYGQLIHNRNELKYLKSKNIFLLRNKNKLKKKRIIIRSHGISKLEEEKIKKCSKLCVDATCPFVLKIHNIVKEYSEKEYEILIIGDKNHSEVKGIAGWCFSKYQIINSEEEAENYKPYNDKVCVVVQTTFNKFLFNKIIAIILKKQYNIIVNNTICNTMGIRQEEAQNLSKDCDVTLVVGDKNSANTKNLYSICLKNCRNTYYIQNKNDINIDWFAKDYKVFIISGASTSKYFIKEIIKYVRRTFI